jgi:aspartyl-tRNA synthetase
MMRTHTCGALNAQHIGQDVALGGWVSSIREHPNVWFLTLRDRYGVTQIVLEGAFEGRDEVARESVILVHGQVRRRPAGTERPDEPTGEIEVVARSLEVLGPCKTPPIEVSDRVALGDEMRMKYRFLDLRRPSMLRNMVARHAVVRSVRASLERMGFLEIEPPMFVKSTPEGSRDFVVPSRLYPGFGYALPQSPQLYKQLLMIAGVDRYFSFPRCFRDEDPRRGRQLVHTQIDLEMSFAREDDVFEAVETFLRDAFREVQGITLPDPFPRLSYAEVLRRFGLDKPDLRFGMELIDLSAPARAIPFTVFQSVLAAQGEVKGLIAPGCAEYSRKQRGELEVFVKRYNVGGLAWVKREAGGVKASFERFATPEALEELASRAGLNPGDLLLLAADRPERVARALGELRNHLGRQLALIPEGVYRPLWVVDFPLFEFDEEAGRWAAMHHMFTQPKSEFIDTLEECPGAVLGHLYDVVLNGIELGSGSIRITRPELQRRIMDFVGYPREKAEENFGFFLKAYEYGAPPHAGIALGLDNLVMTMLGLNSLLDVIAFPNNSSAIFPLDGSPSKLDEQTLRELHLSLRPE